MTVQTPDKGRDDMPEAKGLTAHEQRMNEYAEMMDRANQILREPVVRISPTVLDMLADAERKARLTTLAAQSATQLIPSPQMHAEMDRLLDEMGTVTAPWDTERSVVSWRLEDD